MKFQNHYYVMRHGESKANEEGIIVSDPATGVKSYGLTEYGREVSQAGILKTMLPAILSRIYTSDFLRARETGEIVAQTCGLPQMEVSPLLRERFFGNLEGKGDSSYEEVWKRDRKDADNTWEGVESPRQVEARLKDFLEETEERHYGETILLVAHGDVLQILLAMTTGTAVHLHREIPHLDKAEIRPLIGE